MLETQLHGYRQGHQLLDGSIELPKNDQSLIDRLSDLAGPLRPGEHFEPYFTAYPLPSGRQYVVARTWQDLSVSRAGCVRTLSMVIPMEEWANQPSIGRYFDALRQVRSLPTEAVALDADDAARPLAPAAADFDGSELVEALLLEDSRPVAVFDASDPESVSIRLLTAFWPSLRSNFSVSTFALSPRKIDTSFFSLVFAPKDVRSRFSNWPGRRIDAKSDHGARHRWTRSIVDRVFLSTRPQLLTKEDLASIGPEDRKTAAALRLSLLWDELLKKVETSPSAALGLLDVAGSRFGGGQSEMSALQPVLANATTRASLEMAPEDGWAFVAAMLRKIGDTSLATLVPAVANAGETLAKRSPEGAISLLEQPNATQTYSSLVPSIAAGLNESFSRGGERALVEALPETLVELLSAAPVLAKTSVSSESIRRRLQQNLPSLKAETFARLRDRLLPYLTGLDQATLAAPLIASLDLDGLVEEVATLAASNGANVGEAYLRAIVDRARDLNKELPFRSRVSANAFAAKLAPRVLAASLVPGRRDVAWIVEHAAPDVKREWLVNLLGRSNKSQLEDSFSDVSLARQIIDALGSRDSDLLVRIARDAWLPLEAFVSIVATSGSKLDGKQAAEFGRQALQRCLRERFGGDEVGILRQLLKATQGHVDANWIVHNALAGHLTSDLVSRNMSVFGQLEPSSKAALARSIESAADILAGRRVIDLDFGAATVLAELLALSMKVDTNSAMRASARLQPALMRSGRYPVSSVVAVSFPLVYMELAAQDDNIPDLLRILPFPDWDRCKTARHELVDVFLWSDSWAPADFAKTACACADSERIVRRMAKVNGGVPYLAKVVSQLGSLPLQCRRVMAAAIDTSLRWHS